MLNTITRLCIIFYFITLAPINAFAENTASPLQIFILHSYSQEYPWSKSQHTGFTATLSANTETPLLFSTEYLDTKRRPIDKNYSDNYFNYLQFKYSDYTPDLIYVTDDNALLFALEYFDTIFATAPIIFSGVNDYTIQHRINRQRVSGVFEKKDISTNLDILKTLDPDIKEILIIGDASNTYQAIETEIKNQLIKYPAIKASYVSNTYIEPLIEALTQHNEKYLFLTTIGNLTDNSGNTLRIDNSISRIAEAGKFIILSMEDAYITDDVLGGYVSSGRSQGSTAARMAVELLQGKSVEQLSVVTDSPNQYIFNFNELLKNSLILPDDIRKNARIINQPASFYERNYLLILSTIVALASLFIISMLIFMILLSRKNIQIQSTSNRKNELEALVNLRTKDLLDEKFKLNQAQAITHIGNYAWDIKENITSWTDELYRIVGYQPKEIQPSYDFYLNCIHPEDRNLFLTLTGDALQNKGSYQAEYRVIRPNGDIRHFLEQGEVKLDKDHELTGLVGVIQDITENKLRQNELKAQNNFTDTVLEVAGNVIVIIDIHGNFVRFNRAAEELTGFNRNEVLGKPVWDIVIPEEQQAGVKKIFANLRKGFTDIAAQYENDWLTRDGSRRTLDWRNSVLRNNKNEVTHIVTLGYDITTRKAAEDEQVRLIRELNQARKMEALGQLTGGIAHDFNNMLGIIIGYTDLALDYHGKAIDPTILKYFENISQASHRAKNLVKQMMVFSRNDTGKSEVIQPGETINESIKMLRSVIPSSIKIEFSSADNLPNILMDPVQMQQIMMNLCLNARDAMDSIGTLKIDLGWQHNINAECIACHKHITGDWIKLSVADTGSGMTTDVVERIFEPFFTTKEVGKGTGMGMSVLHSIVDNHGGHVLIDTAINCGSTFHILFKPYIKTVDSNDEKNPDEINKERSGHREKILVVDDEPALAEFLAEILESNNYLCTISTNSTEALQLFKANPDTFQLIVTDQTMPELTGIEMIKIMHTIKPDMPAILMTGYSDSVDKEDARTHHFHYMNKPVKSSDFLKYVSDSLKKKKP